MAPYQIPPMIKKIVLRKNNHATDNSTFQGLEITYDPATVDKAMFFKRAMKKTVLPNGMDYIEPELYSESEASSFKSFYSQATYNISGVGTQTASSGNNPASIDAPVTKLLGVYLGANINGYSKENSFAYYNSINFGKIKRVEGETDKYYFEKANSKMPDVEVVYEP